MVQQIVLQAPITPDYFASYLAASAETPQPLCGNEEGWGPLSPYRWDFTPCFLDVWIAAVSVWGILGGLGALWYLYKKCAPQPVKKNWHFYAKLVVIVALVATTAAQAALQIERFPQVWFKDIRFWTTILNIVSLGVIFFVQYVEHWRSRNANGVVLLYWLFLLVVYGVKLRSFVAQEMFKTSTPYFAVFTANVGLAALELVLEWLVPKRVSDYDALGDEDECPIEYADLFSILTFSWMTPMMKYGYKEFLTQDDLWNLRKRDTTRATAGTFEESWAIELEKKKPKPVDCFVPFIWRPILPRRCYQDRIRLPCVRSASTAATSHYVRGLIPRGSRAPATSQGCCDRTCHVRSQCWSDCIPSSVFPACFRDRHACQVCTDRHNLRQEHASQQ